MSGKPSDDVHEALRNCLVHIGQVKQSLVEADSQRAEAIAASDLAAVRKTNRRIADLKDDMAALEEGRGLLERKAAQLASEERLAAADAAIETIRPALEELCALVEEFETRLVEAGALKAKIDEQFAAYGLKYPGALPRLPNYSDFTLNGLNARIKQALTDAAREDFAKIDYLLDDTSTGTAAGQACCYASGQQRSSTNCARRFVGWRKQKRMSPPNKHKDPAWGEWHPLESAPQDGSEFLAVYGDMVVVVRWDEPGASRRYALRRRNFGCRCQSRQHERS